MRPGAVAVGAVTVRRHAGCRHSGDVTRSTWPDVTLARASSSARRRRNFEPTRQPCAHASARPPSEIASGAARVPRHTCARRARTAPLSPDTDTDDRQPRLRLASGQALPRVAPGHPHTQPPQTPTLLHRTHVLRQNLCTSPAINVSWRPARDLSFCLTLARVPALIGE
jgi:hypothetical protein